MSKFALVLCVGFFFFVFGFGFLGFFLLSLLPCHDARETRLGLGNSGPHLMAFLARFSPLWAPAGCLVGGP